ncbi:hypothetical protein [Streptomyces sp. NPDC053726]|uniref:hypothetical protein n=1 Tax=Streptomyces sp. NPDC053726 TaxID=3365713 RepID=UPI0037D35DFA
MPSTRRRLGPGCCRLRAVHRLAAAAAAVNTAGLGRIGGDRIQLGELVRGRGLVLGVHRLPAGRAPGGSRHDIG